MPYLRHRLRDADVWAKVDANGALVTDRDGRVEIVYKPVSGAKTYRAGARNLSAPSGPALDLVVGEAAPEKPAAGQPSKIPADAIHIWTDGGAQPNPGPCASAAVIVDGEQRTEHTRYLGDGTNQVAELTAILMGLQQVEGRERAVIIYSDSQWSIDMLTKGWKAKKNVELVSELRGVCREFKDLRFVKVLAHSGIPLNERCDALVNDTIRRGR